MTQKSSEMVAVVTKLKLERKGRTYILLVCTSNSVSVRLKDCEVCFRVKASYVRRHIYLYFCFISMVVFIFLTSEIHILPLSQKKPTKH